MGCHVNPKDQSKEEFLLLEGRPIHPDDATINDIELPVCLVDNGMFTAAGVAFDQRELDAFRRPDARQKFWFQVPRTSLRLVSDLTAYES